jgi:hypothetical protein
MASLLAGNYTYKATVLGQYEYAIVGLPAPYASADAICKSVGGSLASITSAADNSKLYNMSMELLQAPGNKQAGTGELLCWPLNIVLCLYFNGCPCSNAGARHSGQCRVATGLSGSHHSAMPSDE